MKLDWGINLHTMTKNAFFFLLICHHVVIQNEKMTAIFFSGVFYLEACASSFFLARKIMKRLTRNEI